MVCVCFSFVRAEIDFNKDIRPILSQKCFTCHGPDGSKRKGGSRKTGRLRLDTEEGSRMDLGGYSAVVPCKPDKSELYYLVSTEDEDDRMPPAEDGDRLIESELVLLKRWIEEGGNYARHWSYQTPNRPQVPEISADGFILHNAIDHFIARQLLAEGLTQSDPVDRYALARRTALDLTGLPPTSDEVAFFVNDQSPDAFEWFVQNQLDKPAFGEHWARLWLDLARYADSAGYADDPLRTIWAYRDYVIRSFNENKPFDQFTIEQIAGDLLENPTTDQLIATAFHRNTKTNSEGGTSDEEFRNEAVVDRVNTTMAVWMGTTIDCAQCHTHKYDPITQEEYFRMFAIFNQTADEDRKDEKPLLPLYNEEQKKEIDALKAEIRSLRQDLADKLEGDVHRDRRWQWEQELLSGSSWETLYPKSGDMNSNSLAVLTTDSEGVIVVGDNSAPRDNYTIHVPVPDSRDQITSIRLEVPGHDREWVLNEMDVRLIRYTDSESMEPVGKKIPKLKLTGATASFEKTWYIASDVIDGVSGDRFSGWAVNGNLQSANHAVFNLEHPVGVSVGDQLQIKLYHNFPNKKLKRFRISVTGADHPMPAIPKVLAPALAKSPKDRSLAEEEQLHEFFARHDPQSAEERALIIELEQQLADIKPLTTVPIMQQVSEKQVRQTRIQFRGNYLDKGRQVSPGTPAAFHSIPDGSQADRLGLARWLMDDSNPLTARVVVNRFWEAIYGRGIVVTSEEFGSQGELPSHPDLLDWLAVELMESGWNIQHLLKLMIHSATYRQTSRVTQELLELDPDNRLLSRGPRFRISAEMVRDQALAVSGLLSKKVYGPSVNPLQPELGLKAAFGGQTDWTTSEGEDRYRRGVYTSWRRSNPYPSMVAFDAPNREFCTIRRDRTNTPLQALVTLNDPVYIEAAQALGRRMLAVQGDTSDKVYYGFQRSLCRPPSERELEVLSNLYHSSYDRYKSNPDDALLMATVPIGDLPENGKPAEYAAWAVVGNAILNLDEMFLKR